MLAKMLDLALLPATWLSAVHLRLVRRLSFGRLPLNRSLLMNVGILPLRRHYYEPLFHPGDLTRPAAGPRPVCLDWNDDRQLRLLASFRCQAEVTALPVAGTPPGSFCFDNGTFMSGDADYLYSFVRTLKPRRIIEVGCGNSTLLMRLAAAKNRAEDPAYRCRHTCIEPHPPAWLRADPALDEELIAAPVETVDQSLFDTLGDGDLLFIDSSHIIRPRGDVLFEILEVLPRLRSGVYVHFHDIFTPEDYPEDWIFKNFWLWNEQYLLEALLTGSQIFRIVGALNYLRLRYPAECARALPVFGREMASRIPGSFYIQRV